MPSDFQTSILGLPVISDWSRNTRTQGRLPFVHIFPSDCVDAATKLDDIEDIVLVHFNVLIEPAAPTKGTFAFAVSIMEGYRLGVYGKNL